MEQHEENTLVLIKPDAIQRALIGEIVTRFERVGLKLVAAKMLQPNTDHYFHHYENIGKMVSRRGQKAFDVTLAMMQAGPVLALVWRGVEAVALVRKLVGATEPKAALPGTIRGDYAHMSFGHADANEVGIPNLVHASGDPGEAEQEIGYWFSKEELYQQYEAVHEKFTQTKRRA